MNHTDLSNWLMKILLLAAFVVTTGAQMQSCGKTDKKGLDFARSIGGQTAELFPKSGREPFQQHTQAVSRLKNDLEEACSHAADAKRGKELSAAWKTLRDGLVFPFLKKWETEKIVDPDFAAESKKQVQNSIDALINAYQSKNAK